jgi:hypothetical protein
MRAGPGPWTPRSASAGLIVHPLQCRECLSRHGQCGLQGAPHLIGIRIAQGGLDVVGGGLEQEARIAEILACSAP